MSFLLKYYTWKTGRRQRLNEIARDCPFDCWVSVRVDQFNAVDIHLVGHVLPFDDNRNLISKG